MATPLPSVWSADVAIQSVWTLAPAIEIEALSPGSGPQSKALGPHSLAAAWVTSAWAQTTEPATAASATWIW